MSVEQKSVTPAPYSCGAFLRFFFVIYISDAKTASRKPILSYKMVENLAVLSLMQKYPLLYWNPASRHVDRMMESPRAWEELKKWKSLYGTQRQRNSLQ
jgi:hypothetical protein